MSTKNDLINFIDAVVSGDESAQRTIFSQYVETKAKEILASESNKVSTTAGYKPSREDLAILEVMLGDNIELTNDDTVLVKGKRVGKIKYSGADETGDKSQLYFVGLDGQAVSIRNNDIEDLSDVIARKFPEASK